jgi:hypothetical protein
VNVIDGPWDYYPEGLVYHSTSDEIQWEMIGEQDFGWVETVYVSGEGNLYAGTVSGIYLFSD